MALIAMSSFASVQIGVLYYNLDDATKTAEVTFKSDAFNSNSYYVVGDLEIPESVTYNGIAYSVTSI